MTRGLRIATAVFAVLLVASCGGTAPGASAPPSSPPALLPHANDLATAITNTFARGSAALVITIDSSDTTADGSGTAAFRDPLAEVAWRVNGAAAREIADDDGRYAQADAPDGPWRKVTEFTPTMGSEHPLDDLGSLTEVRSDGEEAIASKPTSRFVGTLPAAGHVAGLGLTRTSQAAVAADPDAQLTVTIWVGDDGLIKRVQRDLVTSTGIRSRVQADLTALGVDVPVKAPTDYQTAM